MVNCQTLKKKRITLTPPISIPHPRLILHLYLHEVGGTWQGEAGLLFDVNLASFLEDGCQGCQCLESILAVRSRQM